MNSVKEIIRRTPDAEQSRPGSHCAGQELHRVEHASHCAALDETGAARSVRQPVSVVVPCCNEAESLPQLLAALNRLAERHGEQYDWEFLLVDDGSQDRTWEMLQQAAAVDSRCRALRHETNRGVAAAIATGLRAAQAETVCSIDADCTYDPEQLSALIPLLTEGVAVVTASPYHPQGEVRNVPGWRLALSQGASALYRGLSRHKLHTYTSCFRVYRRSFVVDLPLENDGFVGVAELLWKVDRQGGRIAECPAVLDVRRYGQSKIRLARVIAGHLHLLSRMAAVRLTGRGESAKASAQPQSAAVSASTSSPTTR